MDAPESMKAELSRWNDGEGIDLESWINCNGNYSLAVGYLTIFWPEFVEFEGYILRKEFSVDALRSFEKSCGRNRESIEAVMNHLHIADLHHCGCEDLCEDKAIMLGSKLKEIYEAKLQWQFPDKPCSVSFYQSEQAGNLLNYEITFWQKVHEQ